MNPEHTFFVHAHSLCLANAFCGISKIAATHRRPEICGWTIAVFIEASAITAVERSSQYTFHVCSKRHFRPVNLANAKCGLDVHRMVALATCSCAKRQVFSEKHQNWQAGGELTPNDAVGERGKGYAERFVTSCKAEKIAKQLSASHSKLRIYMW